MRVLSMRTSILVVALLLVGGSASATFWVEAVGDPVLGDSWTQWFIASGEAGDEPFVLMQAFQDNLEAFETPHVYTDLGGSDWKQIGANSTLVVAGGEEITSNYFSLTFEGDRPPVLTGRELHVQLYNAEDERVANFDIDYVFTGRGGPAWTTVDGTWEQDTPLPEPVSMVMLGCVGAGMLATRKLRGKRAT